MTSSRGGVCSQGYRVGQGGRSEEQVVPNGAGNTNLISTCPSCCYNEQDYPGIKTTELHEQQKISLRLIIADLQTKLMEVQLERDALQDTRQKESQSQENIKIHLKNTIPELEAASQLQDEMLREANSQTEHLKKMVQSHEDVLLELCGILRDCEDSTGKKLCEHEDITNLHIHNLSTAFADVLQDLDSEVSHLKTRVVLVEEELESLKKDSQTQNLLLLQQPQNREQTRRQNAVHAHQISHLESTVSHLGSELGEAQRMFADKVKDFEKQLHLAHLEIAAAKAEQDQHSQESGNLSHQVHQLLVAAIKEKNESISRISSLTFQLESARDTLHKVQEDLAAKQVSLETAEKTVSDLTAQLQEKERALEVTSREAEKLHSELSRRMQELQHLKKEEVCLHTVQSECGTLKLQLLQKERIIEIFQNQMADITQLVGHHSRAAGAMEVEKSQLIKEINGWKLEAEGLKVAKDETEARLREVEARLSGLELEKVKLVNTCSERLHALHAMKLEKDQLMKELQAGRGELAGLAEAFEDMKRDYLDRIREVENNANRLKMKLKSAQAELEQTRTALKTVEGSDGRAMKVAVGMQKEITAKRGQIDALKSKIKFLEEAMTNAAKEKHYLREENSKVRQELSYMTAENSKIVGELELLRSQDKRVKEKISKMETALDKASMQFAEYQCIIQCQEQEAVLFRLQHTLNVKELQGPGCSSAAAPGKLQHFVPLCCLHPPVLPPPLTWPSCLPPMPSKLGVLKEEPLQDLRRILQELTSSDSGSPSVGLGRDASSGGRSSQEEARRKAGDPSCFHNAGLQPQDGTKPFTPLGGTSISAAPHCVASPKKLSQRHRHRERSPVHLLLTSPPDDLATGPSSSPEHRLSPRKVGSPEGAATVPQITPQPVETTENTPGRLQNRRRSQQNLVESLQAKTQATSSVSRRQEMKTEKAEEENKL
ncbi:coiled-coil domain-containing protein 158 [Heliangelus exortis]|uniref:coiled-coil domain-containing protein 158 n=1 Tax=Heliangelus exortis TaxID=472823 RepID=UPI003A8D8C56